MEMLEKGLLDQARQMRLVLCDIRDSDASLACVNFSNCQISYMISFPRQQGLLANPATTDRFGSSLAVEKSNIEEYWSVL